jgi:hypothetical protein
MRIYRVPGSDILPIVELYRLPIFSDMIQFLEIDKSRLKVGNLLNQRRNLRSSGYYAATFWDKLLVQSQGCDLYVIGIGYKPKLNTLASCSVVFQCH